MVKFKEIKRFRVDGIVDIHHDVDENKSNNQLS